MLEEDYSPGHLFGQSTGTRSALLSLLTNSHDWKHVKGPLGIRLPGTDTREAFMLENMLSPVEAQQLIYGAEQLHLQFNRHGQRPDFLVCDDDGVSRALWARIRPYVPRCHRDRMVQGLSPCLTFLRYDMLETFDAVNCIDIPNVRLVVQLALNHDFQGGQLRFLDESFTDHTDIPALTARAVVFANGLEHRSLPVEVGRKYVLQLGVVYSQPTVLARLLGAVGMDGCPGRRDRFIEGDIVIATAAALFLTMFLLWIIGFLI